MKFTKTTEEFDCTQFEVGKIYYIKEHLLHDKREQGIYLCTHINDCHNEVVMRKVILLQGAFDGGQIIISNGNFNLIDEIQEVQFDTEWDTSFKEWRVTANIEPEVRDNES